MNHRPRLALNDSKRRPPPFRAQGPLRPRARNLGEAGSAQPRRGEHYDVIQASGAIPGEYRIAGMGNALLNYEPHAAVRRQQQRDRFYIDGALHARVESKGRGCVDGTESVWQAPQLESATHRLGELPEQRCNTDVWMDDFAAGASRIGCPDPNSAAHSFAELAKGFYSFRSGALAANNLREKLSAVIGAPTTNSGTNRPATRFPSPVEKIAVAQTASKPPPIETIKLSRLSSTVYPIQPTGTPINAQGGATFLP